MDEFESLLQSFSDALKSKWKEVTEGPPITDQIQAFIHAVDWTEPWIIGLLSFHAVLLLMVLLTRRWQNFQFVVFAFCAILVYLAEHINAYAAHHWKAFSRQNYFDQYGLFVSVLFFGPILVIGIVILVQLMVSTVELMVKWKRAELKHRARKAAQQERRKKE
ncbi:hypothetical protein CLOP_g13787 [Closterium sp. NIES-67]|nr:hypothetical protein CLOP_g13787 [Closterium sp. NIES-67]